MEEISLVTPTPGQVMGCLYKRKLTMVLEYSTVKRGVEIHHYVGFNLFAPQRCGSNFKNIIFKHMLRIMFMSTSCEIALGWMVQNNFDDKSTLFQVKGWHIIGSALAQAPNHCLNQCWLGIKSVLWHSPEINLTKSAHEQICKHVLRLNFRHLPEANELILYHVIKL